MVSHTFNKLGNYEIVAQIGQGSSAVVYHARDSRTQREVALKVMTRSFADGTAVIERFHQESLIASKLDHRNIVLVHDWGELEGMLYLAMRLVKGRTLRQYLTEKGRLTLPQALPILLQLADALDYLQGGLLVHRDLKPANILLSGEEGEFKITLVDFGLVRSLEGSTWQTQSQHMAGTFAYVAPEQIDPAEWGAITPLSDVYALGVIVYEMLMGQRPFTGNASQIIQGHLRQSPSFPPDLGPDLTAVLIRALAKPPEHRYPSAGELVKALLDVENGRQRQRTQNLELQQLLPILQSAYQRQEWQQVLILCAQILVFDSTHPQALQWMTEATQAMQEAGRQEVARRLWGQKYEAGQKAMSNEQWGEAIAAFEAILVGNPNYKDVVTQLEKARREQQYSQWFEQALAYDQQKQWAKACQEWLQLLQANPTYRDGLAIHHLLTAVQQLATENQGLSQTLATILPEHQALRQATAKLTAHNEELSQTVARLGPQNKELVETVRRMRQEQLYRKQIEALTLAIHQENKDWSFIDHLGQELLDKLPHLTWIQQWVERAQADLFSEAIAIDSQPADADKTPLTTNT